MDTRARKHVKLIKNYENWKKKNKLGSNLRKIPNEFTTANCTLLEKRVQCPNGKTYKKKLKPLHPHNACWKHTAPKCTQIHLHKKHLLKKFFVLIPFLPSALLCTYTSGFIFCSFRTRDINDTKAKSENEKVKKSEIRHSVKSK